MKKDCLNNKEDIEFIAEACKILSEPNRIKILCLLSKNKKICGCEIIAKLKLKQNLVSHHLSMFKRIGLVETERVSKNIYYSIDEKTFKKLKKIIGAIFNF